MKKILLTLTLVLGFFVFNIKESFAATFMLKQGDDGGQLFVTVDLDFRQYSPGQEVWANLTLVNNSSTINLGSTNGGTNGMWVNLLSATGNRYAQIGYAPQNSGTYNANFTTNFSSVVFASVTPEVSVDPLAPLPYDGYCTGKPVTDNACYYLTEVYMRVNLSQALSSSTTIQLSQGDLNGSVTVPAGNTQNSVKAVSYYTHFGGTRLPDEGQSGYTYNGFSFSGNGIAQYNPHSTISSCSVTTGNAVCD